LLCKFAMRIFKIILTLSFVSIMFLFSIPANATCSTRILKQVCDVCAEKAQSKLHIDASCPVCEKVNCPTASLACIQLDSFKALLRSKYTLTTKLLGDGEDLVFRINTAQSQNSPNTFSYEARGQNYRLINNDGFGFIFYDVVNFTLPVYAGTQLLSYNCTGVIDRTSVIKGYCSTIAPNSNGQPQTYGGSFIAIPD